METRETFCGSRRPEAIREQMKATRRRQRKPDLLAAPRSVRAVLENLRKRLLFPIPQSEKDLIRFLYAIGHIERFPATDTRRGRPGRWTREQLTEAASILRGILERETSGRVSVKSFVSQYLQVINFPTDLLGPLEAGQINLQEAIYLNRISPKRFDCSPREAAKLRREIIEGHLAVQGSQTGLRERVKEILGEAQEPEMTAKTMTEALVVVDELLEINAADSRHLFWEQLKEIFFAIRNVAPEDLDDEILEEFTAAMDQISGVLFMIRKRKKEREQQIVKNSLKLMI
jgi:hypothetical protein